jgi:hypothetical protein
MTTVKELPLAISNKEACGVVVYNAKGSAFFVRGLDKNDYPTLTDYKTAFTREQAKEAAARIPGSRIIPLSADSQAEVGFWLLDHDDTYDERTIHVNERTRHWSEDIPGWFIATMMKVAPDENWGPDDDGYSDASRAFDVFLMKSHSSWRDHFGWLGEGENSVFVSEPYHLNSEGIKDLVADCQLFNFDFEISGTSYHYPSGTFHIELRPIEMLTYIKRGTDFGPKRTAWESKRTVAFKTLLRREAADVVEHVAHVVKNYEDSEGYRDYEMFVSTTIQMLRDYADSFEAGTQNDVWQNENNALDKGETDAQLLASYQLMASRHLREMQSRKSDGPTLQIIRALQFATLPDDKLFGSTLDSIRFYCREALDLFQIRQPRTGDVMRVPARVDEGEWQKAHDKELWAPYYAQWADELGPEKAS